MPITFNTNTANRGRVNRVQKQNFGDYTSAGNARLSIGLALKFKQITTEQAVELAHKQMEKEDKIGKKLLFLFVNSITGHPPILS